MQLDIQMAEQDRQKEPNDVEKPSTKQPQLNRRLLNGDVSSKGWDQAWDMVAIVLKTSTVNLKEALLFRANYQRVVDEKAD